MYLKTSGTLAKTFSRHSGGAVARQTPHVAILMCTFNGAAYLRQQLDSFKSQDHENWSLHVSDDGSSDETLSLLAVCKEQWAQHVHVVSGPCNGFVKNFLSLTCRQNIVADFYAWSDQDDVWCERKLTVALDWLQGVPAGQPALYCGRTRITFQNGYCYSLSPKFIAEPHFKNALVQSIAGGNTMVFNQAARDLIMEAGWQIDVPSHDWWCYQLIAASGGVVHYDPDPYVLYRQHEENIAGTNIGWRNQAKRVHMLLRGRFSEWNIQNIAALESMSAHFCKAHYDTLMLFKAGREQCFPLRIVTLFRAGIYRQTVLGNLGLVFATLLGRI